MCNPNPKPEQHRRWFAIALTTLTLSAQVSFAMEDGLLEGELGRWLRLTATPQLVDVLGKHPRFQGETLSVVTMRNGRPTHESNRLNRALEEFVTHKLLSQSQVRIAWQNQRVTCAVERTIPYLLGLQIETLSRGRYQIGIALVDVEEGIWVPGVNYRWQGRLTAAERRALEETVSAGANGSISSPMPLTQAVDISRLLVARMRCALPVGVDGPVYLADTNDPQLTTLAHHVRQNLRVTPLFDETLNQDVAQWLLRIHTEAAPGDTAELVIEMSTADAQRTQRIASIYVAGIETLPKAVATASSSPVVATGLSQPLLSPLDVAPAIRCERNRGKRCVQIDLDVLAPSYLLVFRTHAGAIEATSCKRQPILSQPVKRRFNVQLETAEIVGFYAVATDDRKIARALHRQLRHAPGRCGNGDAMTNQQWLIQTQALVDGYGEGLQWRAAHLPHRGDI